MNIRAILFDLHHTLTATKSSAFETIRAILEDYGFDLSHISVEDIKKAMSESDKVLVKELVMKNVDPLWGTSADDWLPFDRIFLEQLGFTDLPDQVILNIENEFKHITRDTDWEFFTKEALSAISSLKEMGFVLGICTRRTDDPRGLIARHNLSHVFQTVRWSGVPGYAKPNPYTLFEAVKEINVNPRRCLFVGNYVEADIEAAIRCEMIPVLLTWANPDERNKAPAECMVFDQPTHLVEWIRTQDRSSTISSSI